MAKCSQGLQIKLRLTQWSTQLLSDWRSKFSGPHIHSSAWSYQGVQSPGPRCSWWLGAGIGRRSFQQLSWQRRGRPCGSQCSTNSLGRQSKQRFWGCVSSRSCRGSPSTNHWPSWYCGGCWNCTWSISVWWTLRTSLGWHLACQNSSKGQKNFQIQNAQSLPGKVSMRLFLKLKSSDHENHFLYKLLHQLSNKFTIILSFSILMI